MPRGSGQLQVALPPPLPTQDPCRSASACNAPLTTPHETPRHGSRLVQPEQGTCSPPLLRRCPCHCPHSGDPEPPTPGSPGLVKPEDTEHGIRAQLGAAGTRRGLRQTPDRRPQPTEGQAILDHLEFGVCTSLHGQGG